MADAHLEREIKLDADPEFVLPDLTAMVPDGATVTTQTHELRATYYDTAEHDLLAARMTLRHRTGGTDAGWHLKMPAGSARQEIHAPSAPDLPDEVRALLRGVVGVRELEPIATLKTTRAAHTVSDSAGRPLVEVADDAVHATAFGDPTTVREWRELEAELIGGDEELLATVADALRVGGAHDSAYPSKLLRAIGAASQPQPSALLEYLAEYHRNLLAGDAELRRGSPEVIHPTRVATRRIRSTVRSFEPAFDEARVAELDAELRWLAALLGGVRDPQVQRARLSAALDDMAPEMVLGSVRDRILSTLVDQQEQAWQTLRAEMDGPRYLALLDALKQWRRDPVIAAEKGDDPAWLRKRARRAARIADRRLARARETGDDDDLHRARKAAKRARYASELVVPISKGSTAKDRAEHYEHVQDLLGELQDSVVSRALLRRLGAAAAAAPEENGFAYGLLWERERDHARTAREQAFE